MPVKKYDWKKLFGRGRFRLRAGRDYSCSPQSMAQQVRNAAAANGLSVQIRHDLVDPGRISVAVSERGRDRRRNVCPR